MAGRRLCDFSYRILYLLIAVWSSYLVVGTNAVKFGTRGEMLNPFVYLQQEKYSLFPSFQNSRSKKCAEINVTSPITQARMLASRHGLDTAMLVSAHDDHGVQWRVSENKGRMS